MRLAALVLFLSAAALGLVWIFTATQPDPSSEAEREGVPQATGTPVQTTAGPNGDRANVDEPEHVARPAPTDTSAGSQNELVVRGSIKTEYGEVTPGESVELYSASLKQRYTAVSSEQGEFVFSGVTPAPDYRVTVSPEGDYGNYVRRGLTLNDNNASFEIILEVLQRGLLRGQVASPQGQPVPGFRLWVRSRSKDRGIRNVLTDSAGFFQVRDFPEGPFEVTSRIVPLRITGLVFDPELNELITLVVDHGPHQLTGYVFDRHGRPVEGVTVVLNWAYKRHGVQSTTARRTLTDSTGTFTMEELGYGKHELVIREGDGPALKRNVVVGETPADIALYLD